MTGGIGWNGIAVALIAGNSPLAVIPAALLFAYLDMGGKTALLASGFPVEMSTLMQGIVFILITARRVRS
jgi:simple sugar transport system permease protein